MPREKVLCGKEEIIRVAVEIVDKEGINALSARRIAKELGVSSMTIYNYVENLKEVKKHVLSNGFDRLYNCIFHALNNLEAPVDKVTFCKTIASQVFKYAKENSNVFTFMFSDGRRQFCDDAEVRPFYNFITKLTKRAKVTQKDWAANEMCYSLLEMLVFSASYQGSSGISDMTEAQYDQLIDFFLERCIT